MKYLSTVILSLSALSAMAQGQNYSDQDVINSYHYILGRHLVLRQEQDDFKKGGMQWNKLSHRPLADFKSTNPDFDVAMSEAWVAIDENSCAMLDVPEIKGRYYTVQTLNGWGETTSNINERVYPKHPAGKFAYCLSGSKAEVGKDIQRIDLPSQKFKMIVRVEVGKNKEEALKLQKMFNLAPMEIVKVDKTPVIKSFTNKKLPGVEAFDNYQDILLSDKDINAGMDEVKSKVDLVGLGAKNKTERARLDRIIKKEAIPSFMNAMTTMPNKEGWMRAKASGNYGADYLSRTLINYSRIWSNTIAETYTFTATKDSEGMALDGKETYTMTFPAKETPETMARYFWSVLATDKANFKAVSNSLKKYMINNQTNIQKSADGSLTLYFSPDKPVSAPLANWIPTVKGKKYDLKFNYYGPAEILQKGAYFPPALIRTQRRISSAP